MWRVLFINSLHSRWKPSQSAKPCGCLDEWMEEEMERGSERGREREREREEKKEEEAQRLKPF